MAEDLFESGLFEVGLFGSSGDLSLFVYPIQSRIYLIGSGSSWLYSFADNEVDGLKEILVAPITIEVGLPEIFTGVQSRRIVSAKLHNVSSQLGWQNGVLGKFPGKPRTDPTLAQITMGWDIRGKRARASLYDLKNATTILQLDGIIKKYNLANGEIVIENLDFASLATEIPTKRVVDLFPSADLGQSGGADPRVIVCFAEMRQVPLFLVQTDNNTVWWYGCVRKPTTGILTFVTVYRDKAVIPSTEYNVVEGRPGYYVISFVHAQIDNSGRFLDITVDLTSTEFGSVANVGSWILQQELDLAVNATSITNATTDILAAGYVLGGGIGPTPEKADNILRELALRGSVIDINSSGEYIWTVDKSSLHTNAQYLGSNMVLGMGDGRWNNISQLQSLEKKDLESCVKEYTLHGLHTYGFGNDTFLMYARAAKQSLAKGAVITEQNRFIGDLTTLRSEAGYRLTRLAAEEDSIELVVDGEMRALSINNLVDVRMPTKGITATVPGKPWMCTKVVGSRGDWTVTLVGYDSVQYSVSAANFWIAPTASRLTDYSFTYPLAPTGFVVVSSTFTQSGDRIKSVIAVLEADAPIVNVTHLVFQVFRTGSVVPLVQRVVIAKVGQLNLQVAIRVPSGIGADNTYDLQCYARNVGNHPDFQDGVVTQILGWIPGTDTTDPAAPVLTEVKGFNQRSALIDWTKPADTDVNEYGIFRQSFTNMVVNPGFESLGFNGWTVNGALGAGESITQSTAEHSGNSAARILTVGTGSANNSISQDIPVVNGTTYTFGGWLNVSSYVTGTARFRVDTGDGVTIVDPLVFSANSGGYKFGYSTFIATGTTVIIYCQVVGAAPNDSLTADFDDISMVAGTPAPVTQIAQVSTDRFTDSDTFITTSSYWYGIKSYDRSENSSPLSNLIALVPVRIPIEDLPNDVPLVLIGLANTGSGTYQASDGPTLAFISLSWTNPVDTKRAYVEVAFKNSGNTTSYLIADQVTGTTARIDDLTPGQNYDFRVRGISRTGYLGPASFLADQTAPGDITLPATVTGLTAVAGTGKAINVDWAINADNDLAEYIIYRGTAANPTGEYTRRRSTSLNDIGVAYDVTYHYRVKARDHTGNISSAFSANVSALVRKILTGDVDDDQITFLKRQLMSSQSINIQVVTPNHTHEVGSNPTNQSLNTDVLGVASGSITHGLGRIPNAFISQTGKITSIQTLTTSLVTINLWESVRAATPGTFSVTLYYW